MEKLVFCAVIFTVIHLISTSPIEFGHDGNIAHANHRVRRQEDPSVRNCEGEDPYYPETTVRTDDQLAELRRLMTENGIHAYIIPSEDAHQSEYIAEADERREYMSGFDGSAGLAIVSTERAGVWVDGRYFLQAKMQLDCNWVSQEIGEPNVPTPQEWLLAQNADEGLAANLPNGGKVGFDPTLLSISTYFSYNESFEASDRGITLLSIEENLVDIAWTNLEGNKPPYTGNDLMVLGTEYTGRTWQEKIYDTASEFVTIREQMVDEGADALVITKLDEIAWVFNMRGKDIPYNPMFISYAIIETGAITLYLYDKDNRADQEIMDHLNPCDQPAFDCITLKDYDLFLPDLSSLGSSNKVWFSDTSSYAIYERVSQDLQIMKASPILLMKARKNDVEIQGLKNACFKDSVSLCELFSWIQEKIDNLPDEDGDIEYLSELVVEAEAIKVRERWEEFTDLSFGSISAFGDHGAIIHYSSSPATDVPITKKGTYMLDSGSQYMDGTTDITRTMHYGNPTDFQKEAYTRVLMGHIDLVMTNFRSGVYGRDIDAIAREPLWSNGLDYRHGTGHGIGHFLNVHEGPARITLGYRSYERPMEVGMFFSDDPINIGNYPGEQPMQTGVYLSDEPGYYEDGSFGLRLENDMIVVPATTDHQFSTYEYMTFEMLSLVPFDPNLIDITLLSPAQIDWYNAYNQRIRDEIGPHLSERAKSWMESMTIPIAYEFSPSFNAAPAASSFSILLLSVCFVMARLIRL